MKAKGVVGIDEAGRGPLAGPLSLGLVYFLKKKPNLIGLKDSKKLSPKKREEWFSKIKLWEKQKIISYEHVFVSSAHIDRYGLGFSLKKGVSLLLKKAAIDRERKILLDAGLKAPLEFLQKSIVKGDEKIKEISLASIVAKVKRDKYMLKKAKVYPKYGFDIHKGYGTKAHLDAISQYGMTKLHRESFFRGINMK